MLESYLIFNVLGIRMKIFSIDGTYKIKKENNLENV